MDVPPLLFPTEIVVGVAAVVVALVLGIGLAVYFNRRKK
ncbi:hypothetical protein SAMN06298212_11147 [Ruaniaceae bacterium KH17]|nr:hypothetical protein SAMN06298212_11147 [Ruaniaceae bacterium KH17]